MATSTTMQMKILVCGDVDGQFEKVFKKVTSLHQKSGPFECVLCVGNFFGTKMEEWERVLRREISVPVTTYILGPNSAEHRKFYPNGTNDLVDNIVYLGKHGLLTCSSGLKIAYLSGVEREVSSEWTFSKKDVCDMISRCPSNGVDILLTSQWPENIMEFSNSKDDVDISGVTFSRGVAHLTACIKPRYHFCGSSGIFYQRPPYRNYDSQGTSTAFDEGTRLHITRFVSLAPVINGKGLKGIYAINIKPLSSLTYEELVDAENSTVFQNPFHSKSLGLENTDVQYFYSDSSTKNKRSQSDQKEHTKKKRPLAINPETCWFCFSNPKVEKQLIMYIGVHSYITLAKGGIVNDHLLIIPMEHIKASVNLSKTVQEEIEDLKNKIMKFFNYKSKDVVFFERNHASYHMQIQVIPIPKSRSSRILEKIENFAAGQLIKLTEVSAFSVLKQIVSSNDYFYVEVFHNGESTGKLIHRIESKFPVNFGRMMLASEDILDCPERIDWTKCVEPSFDKKYVKDLSYSFQKYLDEKKAK